MDERQVGCGGSPSTDYTHSQRLHKTHQSGPIVPRGNFFFLEFFLKYLHRRHGVRGKIIPETPVLVVLSVDYGRYD